MAVHKIDIGGTVYANVSGIETTTEPVFYYNVVTLDGTTHQEIRYIKTTHVVTFFNLLNGQYISLKNFIKSHKNMNVSCGIPDDDDGFEYNDYMLIIQGEKNKGYLNGKYFRNGLQVLLTKVNADE